MVGYWDTKGGEVSSISVLVEDACPLLFRRVSIGA